jgi:hypothetical protein
MTLPAEAVAAPATPAATDTALDVRDRTRGWQRARRNAFRDESDAEVALEGEREGRREEGEWAQNENDRAGCDDQMNGDRGGNENRPERRDKAPLLAAEQAAQTARDAAMDGDANGESATQGRDNGLEVEQGHGEKPGALPQVQASKGAALVVDPSSLIRAITDVIRENLNPRPGGISDDEENNEMRLALANAGN